MPLRMMKVPTTPIKTRYKTTSPRIQKAMNEQINDNKYIILMISPRYNVLLISVIYSKIIKKLLKKINS